MAHREGIKRILNPLRFENCSIVDWGCGAKPIKNYVTFGQGVEYFTTDIRDDIGADHAGDICGTELGREFDFAFCMEVLEHTESPLCALQTIFKHLKLGGKLYVSVPFLFEKHSDKDYWRYTDDGLELLLEKAGFEVDFVEETEDRQGWIARASKLS